MPKKLHIKGLKRNSPKRSPKQVTPKKGEQLERLIPPLKKKIRQEMPNTVIQWNQLPIKASVVLKRFAAEVIDSLGPRELSPRGALRLKNLLSICYTIWNLVLLASEEGEDPKAKFEGYLKEQKPTYDFMDKQILNQFADRLIERKLSLFQGPEYRFYFKDIDVYIKGDEYGVQAISVRVEDLGKKPDLT